MKTVSPSITRRTAAFEAALSEASRWLAAGDAAAALQSLERGHVLGQNDFGPHLRVHLRMLHVGLTSRDWREVRGQVLRIALVPLGHLLGRLPRGNTGAANVSAFAPMAIAPDIEHLLDNKES
jgi:hypothetical protein